MARRGDRIHPRYRGNMTKSYMASTSKRLRLRLYNCKECKSINTRINVSYTQLKCFDCGITSKFKEDMSDQKAIWYDLLKLEDEIL